MPRKTKQNKICTPELLEQVNPENKQLISDFLSYLKSVQRSETTIRGYTNDLDIFFVWNLQHNGNKFFIEITKRNYVAYQNWLVNENENSPARVRRLRSTISALAQYIENVLDDEYPNFRNIITKIPPPANAAVREKTVLSEEQLKQLLNYLVESQEYQKACLLALAMYSGARKSELVRFKVEFFTPENVILESLWKTPRIKTKGHSGGKYINKFVLKNEFEPYLNLWLEQRKTLGIESEWLFVYKTASESWVQLKPEMLNHWANSFGKYLNVDFYIHSLRHFWCTSLVKKNIPTNVITQLTGWASEVMCGLYTDITPEETFSKYFDKNGIKEVKSGSLTDI